MLPMLQGGSTKRVSAPSATSPTHCKTSRESSVLSSAKSVSLPPGIEYALEKQRSKEQQASDEILRSLMEQSAKDLIKEAGQKIKNLKPGRDLNPACKAIVESLFDKECGSGSKWSELEWSSGLNWLSLVNAARAEKEKGTIKFVITAMGFENWHTSQSLLYKDLPMQTARSRVTKRLLGPKPANDCGEWSNTKDYISTYLSRGKKWGKLVKHLGVGILLKGVWKLGKSAEANIDRMIEVVESDEEKMTVLRILSDQLMHLIEDGQTNPAEFKHELQIAFPHFKISGLLPPDPIPSAAEVDSLYQAISKSATTGRLAIGTSSYELEVAELQRLQGKKWLSAELIFACLYLSDRCPYVRIGLCIPIHQESRSEIPMERPFYRASKMIQAWKNKVKSKLVYFFPLLLKNSHFTLLEINEREGYIYHYNSIRGENEDVKNACEREKNFSEFIFCEQEAIQQNDGHSCGLMVIKHAQNRMFGEPATLHHGASINSTTLRCEAAGLLKQAWEDGKLVEAQVGSKRKRGAKIEKPCKEHSKEKVGLRRSRRGRDVTPQSPDLPVIEID
ncbi:hypothetical protein ACQKWADRAFT_306991 [Trichoderma austrokoningii]